MPTTGREEPRTLVIVPTALDARALGALFKRMEVIPASALANGHAPPLSGRPVRLWLSVVADTRALLVRLQGEGSQLSVIDEPADALPLATRIGGGVSSGELAAYAREHTCTPAAWLEAHRPSEPKALFQDRPLLTHQGNEQSPPTESGRAAQTTSKAPTRSFADPLKAWQHYGLSIGPGNRPHANTDNVHRVLAADPQWRDALWYDEFARCVMYGADPYDEVKHGAVMLIAMQRELHFANLRRELITEAVEGYAVQHSRHPVREWLAKLPQWDGEKRLEHIFPEAFGTPRTDYYAEVGRNWLISAVARVLRPGCKVDNLVVLESPQGWFKEQALRALADPWYRGVYAESLGSKDFLMKLSGAWFIELAELDQINRATVELVKALITDREDTYRPPYGRTLKKYPRQCIFAGSTNGSQWLSDETGARRFWPVAHEKVKLDWLHSHRLALFAEAVSRFHAGESWWTVSEEQALLEQEQRFLADLWEPKVLAFLVGRETVTIDEIADRIIDRNDRQGPPEARRIGRILRHLNWFPKSTRINGHVVKVFRRR